MSRRLISVLVILAVAWGGLALALANGYAPKLGLDLRGGISVILTAPEGTESDLLEVSAGIMRNRIENLGNVQEPEIAITGDRNVLVQLPGITDQEEALDVVGQTGQLTFRPVCEIEGLVDGVFQQAPDVADACTDVPVSDVGPDGVSLVDDGTMAVWLPERDEAGEITALYLVGPEVLSGSDLANASPDAASGFWAVNLVMTSDGADKFAQLTGDAARYVDGVHRRIAIVLDGEILTAPPVAQGVLPDVGIAGGNAQIGLGANGTEDEAVDLAVVLRYGALPIQLERSQLQKVSATLGQESLETGIIAGLVGLVLVAAALLVYYRSLGLVAVVGLSVFGSLLLLIYIFLGEANGLNLTLAGVTGLIVAIGITADSYIVYFERIKEELREGRVLDEAVNDGFRRAYRTIITADFVSMLAAVLLYALAIGPVKGFALALGIATALDLVIARLFTYNAVSVIAQSAFGQDSRFSIRRAAGVEA